MTLLAKLKDTTVLVAVVLTISVGAVGATFIAYPFLAAGTGTVSLDDHAAREFPTALPEEPAKKDPSAPVGDVPQSDGTTKLLPKGTRFYDFGKQPQGTVVKVRFPLDNPTGVPLNISGVRISCGCVEAIPSKKVLQPNEQGELLVSLDTVRPLRPRTITILVKTESNGRHEELRYWVTQENLK